MDDEHLHSLHIGLSNLIKTITLERLHFFTFGIFPDFRFYLTK